MSKVINMIFYVMLIGAFMYLTVASIWNNVATTVSYDTELIGCCDYFGDDTGWVTDNGFYRAHVYTYNVDGTYKYNIIREQRIKSEGELKESYRYEKTINNTPAR